MNQGEQESPTQKTCLIQIQNASKSYLNGKSIAVQALNNVNLEIWSGQLVTIIGPSGCGKTTLLNLVAGITKPSSGYIFVAGQQVEGPSPNRTMIFQEHNLFPWKTVMQNVEFGLKANGMKRNQREETAQRYIDLVQLNGFENKFPFELSGGMRQRVAIARALVMKPTCVLMDEPFGALDSQLRSILQDELLNILATEQNTVLFVTHNVEEAIYLSDQVVIFSKRPGRVIKDIKIALPRPRKTNIKESVEFQKLKSIILAQLSSR